MTAVFQCHHAGSRHDCLPASVSQYFQRAPSHTSAVLQDRQVAVWVCLVIPTSSWHCQVVTQHAYPHHCCVQSRYVAGRVGISACLPHSSIIESAQSCQLMSLLCSSSSTWNMCVCMTAVFQHFHGKEWACVFISVLSHIKADWLPTLVCMPVMSWGCHMVAWSYLLSPAVSEHNHFLVWTCLFLHLVCPGATSQCCDTHVHTSLPCPSTDTCYRQVCSPICQVLVLPHVCTAMSPCTPAMFKQCHVLAWAHLLSHLLCPNAMRCWHMRAGSYTCHVSALQPGSEAMPVFVPDISHHHQVMT